MSLKIIVLRAAFNDLYDVFPSSKILFRKKGTISLEIITRKVSDINADREMIVYQVA